MTDWYFQLCAGVSGGGKGNLIGFSTVLVSHYFVFF
jgi:hypothetical protein